MYKKLLIALCAGILASCSSSSGFVDPKGNLETNVSAIQTVGQNEITFYNTGKSAVSINNVTLEENTDAQMQVAKDSIIEDVSNCKGAKLYSNQSCKIVLLNQKAKTGTDVVIMDTDIGQFKYEIKVSTPSGDLDLSTNQINSVGQNTFTLTNNRNSAIKLSKLSIEDVNTTDTSSDITNCFGVTLSPHDSCSFNVHSMSAESGIDKVTVNTDVGDYIYDIGVNTSDSDLVLTSHAITESGINILYLKNMSINAMTINYVSTSQDGTYDTIDASQCNKNTLKANETCEIKITTIDKVAGIDTLTIITDVGNYIQTINVDTTGAGLLDTDDTANIDTTKEQKVRIYNKGSMPIKLNNFTVAEDTSMQKMIGLASSNDDSLQINDSTCLDQILGGGQVCEIIAKAKGNTYNNHIVSFTTNNGHMQAQPIKTYQNTTRTTLEIYDNQIKVESGLIDLSQSGMHNLMIKNSGSNDLTINKLNLNNSNVGSITRDTCTGTNVYAGEYCEVDFTVSDNAYGSEELTISTSQNHPNNKLLFSTKISELLYDDGTSKTNMPTNSIKEFKLKNPNNFKVKINSLIFDTTSYSVIENNCDGANLVSGGTCSFKLNSNGNYGTTYIKIASDSYPSGIQVAIQVTNGITIAPKVTKDKFYQSFEVTNPFGSGIAIIGIDNKSTGVLVTNGQATEKFKYENCAKFNGNIPESTVCEYMVMYSESSTPDSGEHIVFNINSNGGLSTQDYVSTVTKHNEVVPGNYKPYESINAYYNPKVEKCIQLQNKPVTYSVDYYTSGGLIYIIGSGGYTLQVESDATTLSIVPFYNDTASCYVSSPTHVLLENVSPTEDTVIYNNYVKITLLKTSHCSYGFCTLFFDVFSNNQINHSGVAFPEPIPASTKAIVDSIIWK